MTVADFLLPVFAQVLLTFALHILMARERLGSISRGEVKVKDIALRQPNWSERATQVSNAYHNQLELPMLFYALIAFILISKRGDTFLLIMAWVFVLSRFLHAYIHVTSNNVDHRFKSYGIGMVVLLIMWIGFAIKVLTGA
jgi:hypothetical protein